MADEKLTEREDGKIELIGSIGYESDPQFDLQTNTGLFLWNGREGTDTKSFIMGMPSFMKRLRNAESAIAQDDPYADKMYFLTERAIDEAVEALTQMKESLSEISASGSARLVFPKTEVKDARIVTVRHHSRLGFRSLDALILADECARLAMEAHHKGRFGMDEKRKIIDQIQSRFRSIFHDAARWKYTGVTRDDIATKNQVARDALKKFGPVEREFLHAELRSKFAPDLPDKRRVVIREATAKSGDLKAG